VTRRSILTAITCAALVAAPDARAEPPLLAPDLETGGGAVPAPPASAPAAIPLDDEGDSGADDADDGSDGPSDDGGGDDDDGEIGDSGGETEAAPSDEVRYTKDVSDAELERLWREDPAALGSIALGLTDQGRLVNAQPFPEGAAWTIVDPRESFATQETIEQLTAALNRVAERFPDGDPVRVNDISRPQGGWIRPHHTHQTGRDVDLAFYYRSGVDSRPGRRRAPLAVVQRMDLARNWELVKALCKLTDVQVILLDKRIQKALYDYALENGENRDWLDSLFRAGKDSLLQHARRHADHFHIRFHNPRAQELGRRLQPLMGKVRPEENFAMHRVRRGDTLGAIARKYHSTVALIMKANHLRRTALSIGQGLMVPVRGPCVQCPVAPAVVVPPRRLPPLPPSVAMR
jgi:LysM repeat protein